MSAHTPAPWQAKESFEIEDDELISLGLYVINSKGKEVCEMPGIGYQDFADARLISAAPELLAALEALFDADMEHVLMGDGKYDQIDAIAMARAAIAKATGAAT